jgi:hypothetical protein
MVYSAPTSIIQNLKLQQNPRYVQQFLRRNAAFRGSVPPPVFDPVSILRRGANSGLQRDWGIVVGAGFTMGDANFPAKYQFDVNAPPSCTADYVVFTTSQTGAAALDIYGVNNLYVNSTNTGFCSGTSPNVLWAYHVETKTGGAPMGSPVLSEDGTQIAWMESAGTGATLHILKPYTGTGVGTADGTIAAPNTPPTSANAAAYRACTPAAPTGGGATSNACLFNITFADAHNDTTSSPFYDYSDDTIFVGDATGDLHAFSGVFNGDPAELTANGWPVAVHAGHALTSPIYDTNSQHVFVGDSAGQVSYVAVTAPFTGALGGTVWALGAGGISNDGPIVDGTTGRVFIFARITGTGPVVAEADTSLGTHTGPVTVGTSTNSLFHAGTFDNGYYNTDTSLAAATGNLYVCGNNGAANHPELIGISVSAGLISTGTPTSEFTAATASTECSPVSEFYNTNSAVDYIFFSVHARGEPLGTSGCGGTNNLACVYAATVTGGTFVAPLGAGTGALAVSGGTSGIIVDNDATGTAEASVYYTWLANGTTGANNRPQCNGAATTSVCAVHVTQSGLN